MEARAVPIASPGKPTDQLCINTIRTFQLITAGRRRTN